MLCLPVSGLDCNLQFNLYIYNEEVSGFIRSLIWKTCVFHIFVSIFQPSIQGWWIPWNMSSFLALFNKWPFKTASTRPLNGWFCQRNWKSCHLDFDSIKAWNTWIFPQLCEAWLLVTTSIKTCASGLDEWEGFDMFSLNSKVFVGPNFFVSENVGFGVFRGCSRLCWKFTFVQPHFLPSWTFSGCACDFLLVWRL